MEGQRDAGMRGWGDGGGSHCSPSSMGCWRKSIPSTHKQHPPARNPGVSPWVENSGVSPCSWAAPSLVPLSQSNPLPPVGTHRSPRIPRDSPRGDPSWVFAPAPIGAHPKDGHLGGRLCRARREGRRTLNTSSAARAIAQGRRLPGGEKANCKAAAEKKNILQSSHLSIYGANQLPAY